MFKKISVIMLLTALSIFTAQTASAEREVRSNKNIGIRAEIRASTTIPKLEAKNGELVVSGKVTAINGSTLSIDVISVSRSTTTKSVSTSTIAHIVKTNSSTKFFKEKGTSTASSIMIGDVIIVNGRAEAKGSTTLTAKIIHNLGAINPLRRFEDVNKPIMNKMKDKKVSNDDSGDDNDDDKASSSNKRDDDKKGVVNWFKGLFGF